MPRQAEAVCPVARQVADILAGRDVDRGEGQQEPCVLRVRHRYDPDAYHPLPASGTLTEHLLPLVIPPCRRGRLAVQETAERFVFLCLAIPIAALLKAERRVLVPEDEPGERLTANEAAHTSPAA